MKGEEARGEEVAEVREEGVKGEEAKGGEVVEV